MGQYHGVVVVLLLAFFSLESQLGGVAAANSMAVGRVETLRAIHSTMQRYQEPISRVLARVAFTTAEPQQQEQLATSWLEVENDDKRLDVCDEQLYIAKDIIQDLAYVMVTLNDKRHGKFLSPECEHELFRMLDNFGAVQPDQVPELGRKALLEEMKNRGMDTDPFHFNPHSPQTWTLASLATALGANRFLRQALQKDILNAQAQPKISLPQNQQERRALLKQLGVSQKTFFRSHKFQPWFATAKRSAKVVGSLISQTTKEQLLGQNEKSTTVKYWAPQEKRSTMQSLIVSMASGVMYVTLALGYVLLYFTKAHDSDKQDTASEKKLTVPIIFGLASVSVFILVTAAITSYKSWGIQEETVFSPGRPTAYLRGDTISALFTIFLWLSIATLLVYYWRKDVDDQTLTTFLLKLVALLSVVRTAFGMFVSFGTKKEDQWGESLQFFLLRQLKYRVNQPFGRSPWLQNDALKVLWVSGFLPEQCKPAVAPSNLCMDPTKFLFHDECAKTTDHSQKTKPVGLGDVATKLQEIDAKLAKLENEHKHNAEFTRLNFALGNLMETCATAVLCDKTHKSARMQFASDFLQSSSDSIGFILGALGATAALSSTTKKSDTSL